MHELTERERQVLRLIADGHGNADIAREMNWSEHTVKNRIHDLTTKLGVRNRAHAAAYAIRHNLI